MGIGGGGGSAKFLSTLNVLRGTRLAAARGARDSEVAQVVTLGAERYFFMGRRARARPEEGTIVTESIKRTMPWRILAALVVACLLAVGGWVFAQDKPAAPAAPAASAPAPAAAPAPPSKPDPAGTATGGIADVTAKEAGKPTLTEIADFAGHNRVSINLMWTLLTGFLVMFMQAGFALAETGFTRAKNVAHTMMMNFMVYAIGMTGYWIMGFALHMGGLGAISTLGGTGVLDSEFTISLFGKDFGLFGMKGFFLAGSTYDVAVFALFLFQMVFMDTAATIPTGAMAERWKFSSFVVYGFFISMISYPIFANWVWGGGWLSQLGKNFGLGHGHVDFAGSSVVHMVGGVTALAGAMVLGPRIGKYNKDGSPNPIPGHNIPMAALGCFILAFGWFGFNPGSTLAAGDLRISVIAVNTMLASASGAIFAMFYMWMKYGKPDPSMMINGMLAGLVAITAPCAFVSSFWAFVIGAFAGLLVCWSVLASSWPRSSARSRASDSSSSRRGSSSRSTTSSSACASVPRSSWRGSTCPRWVATAIPRSRGPRRWCTPWAARRRRHHPWRCRPSARGRQR